MPLRAWFARSEPQAGAPGLRALVVSPEQWRQVTLDLVAAGARLVAIWASMDELASPMICAAFLAEQGGIVLALPIVDPDVPYRGIEDLFPGAARMQRAMADLSGIHSTDPDVRPWLRHAAWPRSYRPLIDQTPAEPSAAPAIDDYEFVRVEGDGVHEIAVGPVHAGTIEPGHFRLSVVGEKVLRLEERLGYAHKGIEKLFERTPMARGHILAARVSGDATIAFGWAYCMAVEALTATPVPPRALWLRALMLENERVANHLGDLGALGNDAGLAFGLAQFSRLREDWLRLNAEIFGHRLLMDRVVPGGVAIDLGALDSEQILKLCKAIEHEVTILKDIYEGHAGLQDRLVTTGRVTRQLALQLGLTGLAARAR